MKPRELWANLQEDFKVLRQGAPGHRFRNFRDFKKEQAEHAYSVGRLLRLAIGFCLIVGGIAIGWIPGPGGFIAFVGLAMVADVIPGAAAALDYGEIVVSRFWRWFRRQAIWIQVSLYLASLATSALFIWWLCF